MTSAAGGVCRVHGFNVKGEYECKSQPFQNTVRPGDIPSEFIFDSEAPTADDSYRQALIALDPHVERFVRDLARVLRSAGKRVVH